MPEIDPNSSGSVVITYNVPGYPDPAEVPFHHIDEFHIRQMQGAMVLSVTIGACSMLLIFLIGILYINRQKMKRSFLFLLNIGILLATIFRSACYLNYYTSNLAGISYTFTGIYNDESFASSDAANGFLTIMFVLIQTSLCYQIYVMFKTTTLKYWGYAASALAGLLSLTTLGTQIARSVLAHQNFASATSSSSVSFTASWMDVPTILFAVSVNIMTLLLLFKLGLAIKTRRYLGLKQFDGFHILFIMSTQTLIIPSILLFIHYFSSTTQSAPILVNIAYMSVVIFLPMSSLWAQTANNSRRIESTPSLSFISRESSNSSAQATVTSGHSKISKLNTFNSTTTSPVTLKDEISLIVEKEHQPVSGLDAALPKDLEKFLADGIDEGEDGMVAREVTILKN
ncbi:uncharacterized protein LODBEIA_P14900 [Lodderomyces beijingensis]|uniref:Pheromone alpha factor receptor n=1 Tax=Lodderomyces beijingensis TaxID=1775926 RepID=A0ABP0ZJF3_9ASCO